MAEDDAGEIRVVCVDYHAEVRLGLKTLLAGVRDLKVVGEAASCDDALDLCKQVRPDVVLMNLVMPGMSGPSAVRLIRERWPGIEVLALARFRMPSLMDEMAQAGGACCLMNPVTADALAAAIRGGRSAAGRAAHHGL